MIVDLVLNIDGLILDKGESVEDYIDKIQKISNSNHDIIYDIIYMEE